MYCHTCGKDLKADARFCTGCGTPVAIPNAPWATESKQKSVAADNWAPAGPTATGSGKSSFPTDSWNPEPGTLAAGPQDPWTPSAGQTAPSAFPSSYASATTEYVSPTDRVTAIQKQSGKRAVLADSYKSRGGCLTVWLLSMMILCPIVAVGTFVAAGKVGTLPANNPLVGLTSGLLMLAAGLLMLQAICAYAMWKWKMWGFLGIVGLWAIGLIINVMQILGGKAPAAALIVPGFFFALFIYISRPELGSLE